MKPQQNETQRLPQRDRTRALAVAALMASAFLWSLPLAAAEETEGYALQCGYDDAHVHVDLGSAESGTTDDSTAACASAAPSCTQSIGSMSITRPGGTDVATATGRDARCTTPFGGSVLFNFEYTYDEGDSSAKERWTFRSDLDNCNSMPERDWSFQATDSSGGRDHALGTIGKTWWEYEVSGMHGRCDAQLDALLERKGRGWFSGGYSPVVTAYASASMSIQKLA